MIVYHLDKLGSLAPGQRLRIPYDDLYHSQSIDPFVRDAMYRVFPDGLSRFGYSVLSAVYTQADIGLQTQELLLELVRCRFFPSLPSRLQSFFAAPSISSIRRTWLSALRSDTRRSRVYACEASRVYRADAALRDRIQRITLNRSAGPHNPQYPDEAPLFDIAPFPPSCIAQALEYWKHCQWLPPQTTSSDIGTSGLPLSDSTEFLVQGDVSVLCEVPLP